MAYNLSETLKENKLELECQDYKKIKELIEEISKKRFEGRPNHISKDVATSLPFSGSSFSGLSSPEEMKPYKRAIEVTITNKKQTMIDILDNKQVREVPHEQTDRQK